MADRTPLDELVVGERFWLRQGQTMVEAAVAKREAAGERLTTALAWFWTVYSGAAVLGATLRPVRSTWAAVLLAVPGVLLVAAYLTAVSVTVPVAVSFDPRAPADVETAFWSAARAKAARLRLAHALTATTAACVAAAVVVSALTPSSPVRPTLAARAVTAGGSARVFATGTLSPGVTALVSAVPADPKGDAGDGTGAGAAGPDGGRLVVVPRSGRWDAVFSVPRAEHYVVTVSWPDGDTQATLRRRVDVP